MHMYIYIYIYMYICIVAVKLMFTEILKVTETLHQNNCIGALLVSIPLGYDQILVMTDQSKMGWPK